VGSVEHVELLRRRCRAFYGYALMVFERGDYDTAMFMCEQAVQFCLKAVLLRILGFVPRGHGVRELLGMLSKTLEELGKLELSRQVSAFAEIYRDGLRLLEDAYVGSRYLAKTYEREDAARSIEVVRSLIKLVEVVEQDVFS